LAAILFVGETEISGTNIIAFSNAASAKGSLGI